MAQSVAMNVLADAMSLVALGGCGDSNGESNANRPWFPSLAAFEHYDSGRSHLFPQATFGGRFSGNNTVAVLQGGMTFPSPWNVTYLNPTEVFLYGGSSGDDGSSIGAYVAEIDPNTLGSIWFTQLFDAVQNGEWNYPGTEAILDDGDLYVIYGYHLSKIDPATGNVLATLVLPTGDGAPADTSFNGFSATSDGTIVAKSFYRQAGCTVQGPNALAKCPDPSDVPNSIAVTVDPKRMTVIDQTTLPAQVIGRVTVGRSNDREYAYFFSVNTCIRYAVDAGRLTLDSSWNPGALLVPGQTAAWALVVLNDWVIGQSNGLPASLPLSVFAVNQGDASQLRVAAVRRRSHTAAHRGGILEAGTRRDTSRQLERGNGLRRSGYESDLCRGRAPGRNCRGSPQCLRTADRLEGESNDD